MAKICDFIINIDGKPTELTREELIDHLSKVDAKTGESPFDTFVKQGAKVIDLSSIEQARLSGVSASSLNKVAERLGLARIPAGEVLTPQEYAERGRLLIEAGVDPEQIANEFMKNGTVSADTMSVVRAHADELMKIADDARKKFGSNSEEYKSAADEWNRWATTVVKPMGTEFGRIGRSMQGQTDIDTGSFLSMAAAYEKETGKPPSKEVEAKIEQLVKEKQESDVKIEELQAKLTEIIDKATKDAEAAATTAEGIKEKAKKVASVIRSAKLSKPDMFSAASPASLVWDGALEVAAKTVEISGDIAQGVKDGIEYIKQSEWYKNLDSEKRKEAEQQFKDSIENNTSDRTQQRIENLKKKLADIKEKKGKDQKETKKQAERVKSQEELNLEEEIKNAEFKNLVESFVNKKDSKFTMSEVKSIWNYAKEAYLNKGATYEDMLSGVAIDLGLSMNQVREAITQPKQARAISDEMYREMNKRRAVVSRAEYYIKSSGDSKVGSFFKSIPNVFFAAKTFGHGTVGAITHAGMNIFQPSRWKQYFPFFIKQFKYAFGDTAKYEQAMEDLKNDPDFTFWERAGLAVNPKEKYDDYQGDFAAKASKTKLGKFFIRAGVAGDRGFNALKVYRLGLAKSFYDNLSASEKADPKTATEIARLVNHATGSSEVTMPKWAGTVFFAPKLEASRWQGLIGDPVKAALTFKNWNKATIGEKASAKLVARNAGEKLAVYLGLLALNAGILAAIDSDDEINVTDPSKSDFMKFKIAGRPVDPTGGMTATMRFIYEILSIPFVKPKKQERKTPLERVFKAVGTQARYKLSPFGSTALDLTTQEDAMGRQLGFLPWPWVKQKPKKGEKPYTFTQYMIQQQTPIPFAEGWHELHSSMKAKGVKESEIDDVLKAIAVGGVSGFTGVKVNQPVKHKKN
jgi:hypothetical protein